MSDSGPPIEQFCASTEVGDVRVAFKTSFDALGSDAIATGLPGAGAPVALPTGTGCADVGGDSVAGATVYAPQFSAGAIMVHTQTEMGVDRWPNSTQRFAK